MEATLFSKAVPVDGVVVGIILSYQVEAHVLQIRSDASQCFPTLLTKFIKLVTVAGLAIDPTTPPKHPRSRLNPSGVFAVAIPPYPSTFAGCALPLARYPDSWPKATSFAARAARSRSCNAALREHRRGDVDSGSCGMGGDSRFAG